MYVSYTIADGRGNGDNETTVRDWLWLFKLFTMTELLVHSGALDPSIMKEFLAVY